LEKNPLPKDTDLYDITQTEMTTTTIKNTDGTTYEQKSMFGNTNYATDPDSWIILGWDKEKNGKVDIRLFYA